MKIRLLLFLFVLANSVLFSQEIQKFDSILKIENLKLHSKEIRVYKDYSTSTGLELFRFFQDEHEKWFVEFYETIAQNLGNNEFKIKIRKKNLNSLKNLEVIWLNLYYSDIMDLPDFEEITYKLRPKKVEISIEEGNLVMEKTNRSIILDGISYYVQINNGEKNKELEYPNPESYLKKYPEVDELISFEEFLNIIKEEFNLFKK